MSIYNTGGWVLNRILSVPFLFRMITDLLLTLWEKALSVIYISGSLSLLSDTALNTGIIHCSSCSGTDSSGVNSFSHLEHGKWAESPYADRGSFPNHKPFANHEDTKVEGISAPPNAGGADSYRLSWVIFILHLAFLGIASYFSSTVISESADAEHYSNISS